MAALHILLSISAIAFAVSSAVYAVFSTWVLILARPLDKQQQHAFTSMADIANLFSSTTQGVYLTTNLYLKVMGYRLDPGVG